MKTACIEDYFIQRKTGYGKIRSCNPNKSNFDM
jgi:hypothetical protein